MVRHSFLVLLLDRSQRNESHNGFNVNVFHIAGHLWILLRYLKTFRIVLGYFMHSKEENETLLQGHKK